MKKQNKNKRGFTLIELMIVIAIIGILAAIAVPNFTKARRKSKEKACVANMKTMESAVEMYMMESASTATPALSALAPYMQKQKVPTCPSGGKYTIQGTQTSGLYLQCSLHGTTISSHLPGEGAASGSG